MADDSLPTESSAVILARMEVKLDHALAASADHETRIRSLEDRQPPEISDHESRIRALERKVWVASGVVGLIASGGTTALMKALGG